MTGSLAIDVGGSTDGLQAAMIQAAQVSDREMQRVKKAVEYATTALREIEKQQRLAASSASEHEKAANALAKYAPQAKAATISVGQLNNALRQTPAQITDIATQLAGGQSPFLIMIQQGGQLRDMFGGFGNMFRGLASFITPAALGVGAVAAAVGTLAYAYAKGAEEQANFTKALRLTGNWAGQTSGSFDAMAKSVAKNGDVTIGTAREINQALVQSGQFGPKLIEPTALAIAKLQQVSGDATADIVKDFARQSDGVAKWALEHNKQYHFLTAAQYDYIKQLDEQGKTEQAQLLVSQALYLHLGGTAPERLGLLENAWDRVKKAISEAWDAAKGFGREKTVDDQIESLKRAIDANKRAAAVARENGRGAGMLGGDYAGAAARHDAMAEAQALELVRLQEQKIREEAAARTMANRQAYEEQKIRAKDYVDKLAEEAKGTSIATKKIAEYREQVEKLRGTQNAVSPEQQKAVEASLRKKYDPESVKRDDKLANALQAENKSLDERIAGLQSEILTFREYGRAVNESAEKVVKLRLAQGDLKGASATQAAEMLAKARALDVLTATKAAEQAAAAYKKQVDAATISIDKEVASIDSQAKLIGASTLQRMEAADAIKVQAEAERLLSQNVGKEAEVTQWAAEQVKKLREARERDYEAGRKFTTGVSNAWAKYQEDATNSAKFAENYVTGSLSKMEDALTNFVTTGKLSFKDLFKFMADEFIRNQIRMQIAKGGSSLASLLGSSSTLSSMFSSNSGAATTTANSLPGDSLDNLINITNGYGTVPGHANGLDYVPYDNYLARLHEGERVLTKQEARAVTSPGTGTVHMPITLYVGSNVSRSEVMAGIQIGMDSVKAQILSSMKHNGVFAR